MRKHHLLIPVLLALLTGVVTAQKAFEDNQYGYTISTIKDWNAIPPAPGEKYMVAKWVSPREIRNLPAEMRIYVFDRGAKAKMPEGVNEGDIPEELKDYYLRAAPKKSFLEWMATDRAREKMDLGKERKLKIKAPRKFEHKARYHTTTRPCGYSLGGRRMPPFFVTVGIIETPKFEYAIELYCSDDARRKMQGEFKRILSSFKIHKERPRAPSEEAEETVAAAGGDGYERTEMDAKDKARKRAREQAERTPGWWYFETDRYIIITNVEKTGKNTSFIKIMAKRLEAMRDKYEVDFPPKSEITAVSIVRVCKDKKTYHDYGGPGGSAGYWFAPAEELVFYMENSNTKTPFAVLNHEAFHQYIYYCCGKLSPHSWYNEGYGDYYSGARISGDGKRVLGISPFAWRKDTIKAACRKRTHVPIKNIIKYSQRDYYANPGLCYAQGWSMIYFLNKGVKKDHPWRKILPTYLKVLQETDDKDVAVEKAFEGVDLDEFEEAWIKFTLK